MGTFSEILESIREFYNEDDIGEGLVVFLGTMRKFNYNEPINPDLKTRIEKYFNYRSMNDRNYAIRGKDTLEMYD